MHRTVRDNLDRKPAVILTLPIDPELKELISQQAEDQGMRMNEYVAKVMAQKLGRPELGRIPRRPIGRPKLQPA